VANVNVDHEFGKWNPLTDRKCIVCGLTESKATTCCLGKAFGSDERLWLLAFESGICDYVNGEWVDWTGRSVDNDVRVLRTREAAHNTRLRRQAEGVRRSSLRKKMAMEDTLMQEEKYRGFNPRPFDD